MKMRTSYPAAQHDKDQHEVASSQGNVQRSSALKRRRFLAINRLQTHCKALAKNYTIHSMFELSDYCVLSKCFFLRNMCFATFCRLKEKYCRNLTKKNKTMFITTRSTPGGQHDFDRAGPSCHLFFRNCARPAAALGDFLS